MFFFGRSKINDAVEECRGTAGAVLLDVREPDEFRASHIPGAVNAPLSAIEELTLPKDKALYVYCLLGTRSRQTVSRLERMGYRNVRSISGIVSYRGELEG